VRVEVQQYPIPAELRSGDYQNDPASRERVQAWINSLWSAKDRTIAELLGYVCDQSATRPCADGGTP
jgi:hypothetical protein